MSDESTTATTDDTESRYNWDIAKWFPPTIHGMDHPYLAAAKAVKFGRGEHYMARKSLVPRYAWALLDNEAIEMIAKYSPILSVGSGNGYNERLLKDAGADIIATDLAPPPATYTDVLKQDAVTAASQYSQRALMLIWPCYADPWAANALMAYRGDTVIYIGEGHWGCTADDRFHEILDKEWNKIEYHWIPQWDGLHDTLYIYRRR